MTYDVIIDQINEEQWQQYASGFSDYNIYQTWAYQEARAEMEGQQVSRAVIKDQGGQVAIICQVRIKKVRLLGLRIGYVQWGPLVCDKDGTLTCTVEAFQALHDAYIPDEVDVLRLVPNICDNEEGRQFSQILTNAGFQSLPTSERYRTLVLQVDDSEEGLRKRLRKSFRRDLKKAENAGIQISHGQNEEYCDILDKLYTDSLKRKGFKGLAIQQFLRAQPNLSENEKMNIIVAYWEGEPASVHVTSNLGDTAVVLLAASNEAGLSCGSSYLIWYEAAVTAFRQGMKRCDLGGIDPNNNPNVYRFKSRLGGEEIYHIGVFEACGSLPTKTIWRQTEKVYNLLRR